MAFNVKEHLSRHEGCGEDHNDRLILPSLLYFVLTKTEKAKNQDEDEDGDGDFFAFASIEPFCVIHSFDFRLIQMSIGEGQRGKEQKGFSMIEWDKRMKKRIKILKVHILTVTG